nr:MAG TPA: Beta-propeller repeat protein [Caudoviricetes sp.]
MAIDNKGNIVTTGRSIYECIKNYADTQGDRSIKEIQCTHGARAAFKTIEEEE